MVRNNTKECSFWEGFEQTVRPKESAEPLHSQTQITTQATVRPSTEMFTDQSCAASSTAGSSKYEDWFFTVLNWSWDKHPMAGAVWIFEKGLPYRLTMDPNYNLHS
ncbi:hypothetical protein AVEN_110335-1 [Araneus ventricosus]|uniref:Uncharacterized protein n=1 Tax=Araneus ventricosus TaxID=182803 RepID=A0A4Y2VBV9_ARAVE|nr:hypothetical protein AVEN_98564-1 [Araneus ventricosus]GBO22012.1 hypothetical protein AVEN_110335-1 [Araneus ventricosus]